MNIGSTRAHPSAVLFFIVRPHPTWGIRFHVFLWRRHRNANRVFGLFTLNMICISPLVWSPCECEDNRIRNLQCARVRSCHASVAIHEASSLIRSAPRAQAARVAYIAGPLGYLVAAGPLNAPEPRCAPVSPPAVHLWLWTKRF